MRPLERHRDAGAYALGVLDSADAFRFEDHLTECALCAASIAEFGPTARHLALYARATPPPLQPLEVPAPGLLERVLNEVSAAHRRGRRRWLYAVAASVVLAVAAPAVAVVASSGTGGMRISATDGRTGVTAAVTAQNRTWGTQVGLEVRDAAGPRVCELVVVGKDGSEETVTSWAVPAKGGAPTVTQGGAAMHPDAIARFEVRTSDGHRLVALNR